VDSIPQRKRKIRIAGANYYKNEIMGHLVDKEKKVSMGGRKWTKRKKQAKF